MSDAERETGARTQERELIPGTANEYVFHPNEHFGPFDGGILAETVRELHGEQTLVAHQLDGPEGTTLEGYLLYPGTNAEVRVIPRPDSDAPFNYTFEIVHPASPWKSTAGVSVGTTLRELEALNGKPFYLLGFGWDYGGTVVDWDGGKLDGHLIVLAFDTGDGQPSAEIVGDRELRSDNPALTAGRITVSSLGAAL